MADVTLLVENCIACVLFIWGTFFLVNVACRYNKPDSELSVVAERIRKEAQDHIILITSQCAFCKVVFSYFVPLTLASGRPEVVAKKFNIKMAKVTLRIAPDLFVLFHGCPRTFFFSYLRLISFSMFRLRKDQAFAQLQLLQPLFQCSL